MTSTHPTRRAVFAGRSYPLQPDQLREYLEAKLQVGAARLPVARYIDTKVRGIVTPHIDFHRGGHVEAASYFPLIENVLATGKPFDTLVVLGIAHSGLHFPFSLAPCQFETPFGTMELDGDFACELEKSVGPSLTGELESHVNEHSIEFATVFCQFFEELRPARIVPVLCGGFWYALRDKEAPETAEEGVADFIGALQRITAEHEKAGKKIGFIASVDGAHVGTQFGDSTPLTPPRLSQIEIADRQWCALVESGDRAAFHAHFARDFNRFNVDAHPALYTLMAAFPRWRGQLLDYDQAFHPHENIVVSFASLALMDGELGL